MGVPRTWVSPQLAAESPHSCPSCSLPGRQSCLGVEQSVQRVRSSLSTWWPPNPALCLGTPPVPPVLRLHMALAPGDSTTGCYWHVGLSCVCMCARMYMYVYVCAHVITCVCMCMRVHVHMCVHMCACVGMCVLSPKSLLAAVLAWASGMVLLPSSSPPQVCLCVLCFPGCLYILSLESCRGTTENLCMEATGAEPC